MTSPRTPLLSRRRLVGTAAAGAAVSAFASAPAVIRAQDAAEVRIASYTIGEAWDATVQGVIDEFNTLHPEIKVTLEFRPADQYWDKLQTEYAGGQAPDATLINSNWLVPGASRGMFTNLSPLYERDQVDLSDLWYDMSLEWGYEGGIYGALLYAGGQMTYVNKDLFAAKGVELPAAGWTWDDLLKLAQALTDSASGQFGLGISNLPPPYWSTSFIHGAGGVVLNETSDECLLNSAESRAGLQWIVDAIHTHKVMPIPTLAEGQEDPFLTGKIAINFGGSWLEAGIRTAGFDWDFVPMPAHPTTGIISVQLGSNAWGMLSTTKNEDATWELLKYLGGPEAAQQLMTLGIPGFTSVVESKEYLDLHAPQDISIPLGDFREHGHDYYPTEDSAEWWDAVDQELGPMWTGEDTVESSTQRATDRVNEIFAQRGSF